LLHRIFLKDRLPGGLLESTLDTPKNRWLYEQYSIEAAAADAVIERAGDGNIPDDLPRRARSISVGALRYLMAKQSRNRVLECARRHDVVKQAVDNLEFSLLAGHVHNLAQLFHKLYHGHPIVPEEDESLRLMRRAVFTLFADEMKIVLEDLLGIPVPEEM